MDDVVEERAALGRARIAQKRLQRIEPEDSPRIDRIGIAAVSVSISVTENSFGRAVTGGFGSGRGT